MQVLVDTSVWSLALRRAPALSASKTGSAADPPQLAVVSMLHDLVLDARAVMLGPVRQELLSGIKSATQFRTLQSALAGFEDIALSRGDYELAAEFFNTCRGNGVQGSNTDFLICAAASARNLPILTTDLDFKRYQKYLPINLL